MKVITIQGIRKGIRVPETSDILEEIGATENELTINLPDWEEVIKAIVEDVCVLYLDWESKGVSREITHCFDPPWDHSGTLQVCPQRKFRTLGEWMDKEYTGNSTATYISGMGLSWDTFEEEVIELINEGLFRALHDANSDIFQKEDVINLQNDINDAYGNLIIETICDIEECIREITIEECRTIGWYKYHSHSKENIFSALKKAVLD